MGNIAFDNGRRQGTHGQREHPKPSPTIAVNRPDPAQAEVSTSPTIHAHHTGRGLIATGLGGMINVFGSKGRAKPFPCLTQGPYIAFGFSSSKEDRLELSLLDCELKLEFELKLDVELCRECPRLLLLPLVVEDHDDEVGETAPVGNPYAGCATGARAVESSACSSFDA